MQYKVYKMNFSTGVHFGESSLEDIGFNLHADTLFSSLCIEALKKGGEQELEMFKNLAKNGSLIISDAFPFSGETLFLPKPVTRIKKDNGKLSEEKLNERSKEKKKFKKLKYITIGDIDAYFSGTLNPDKTLSQLDGLGKGAIYARAAVRLEGDTLPYSVGVYYFCEGSGLYFIAGGAKESLDILEELLSGLSESGIGGKKNSGLGKFVWSGGNDAPDFSKLEKRFSGDYNSFISLSVSLPKDDELGNAMEGISYMLLKRSGFVYSENYADEALRKKDLYVFNSGSVFKNKFSGDIFDVSNKGNHKVYRYAKPFFMGVNL